MKRILQTISLLAACSLLVSCQDANQVYVRKAVRIMDKHGIYAEGAEWEAAKAEALAAKPASLEEAREIVRAAGSVAGGKHTFLKTETNVTRDATSTEWEMPSVEVTEDGVAIVKLPPFSGNKNEGIKYTKTVLDAVPDSVRGVVIDLRDNTGGDMYPMIAAVHRLIDDENILRFRSRKRTQWIPLSFVIQVVGVERMSQIPCPVALLTNEWTASSGEAVLLCFRGVDYVRVFGSPTAGYASANQPFPLPDGSQLVLTTGCDVARTGEVFCDDPIAPEQQTETPLEDALAWIAQQAQERIGSCP